MKRLLLVSYEFPPRGGTQAQHVSKLAVGLAQTGWKVDVLTVAHPPTSLLDSVMLEAIRPFVRIHTAFSLEPTRAVQMARSLLGRRTAASTASVSGNRGYTSLPQWAIRLVQALFWPDEKVGWVPWAVRTGVRAGRTRGGASGFQVVLAVGPPFTGYLVAERVASHLGVPWVADLRDPIYGGYFFKPLTPAHALMTRLFERHVVTRARHTFVVTQPMKEEILSRIPQADSKIAVVPNGFDPSDFEGPPPPARPGFTVAYVGTFQASIIPDTFLDAVLLLQAAGDPAVRGLRLRLVGARNAETQAAVLSRGLADIVEYTGFLPHASAVKEMRSAAVLLFVLGPEPESRGILTSKLPEYFASGRPVLALVPEGAAADVLRRYGSAEVVPSHDVRATAEAISRMHRRWLADDLAAPDAEVVAEFDCRAQVARMSAVFAKLAGTPADGPS